MIKLVEDSEGRDRAYFKATSTCFVENFGLGTDNDTMRVDIARTVSEQKVGKLPSIARPLTVSRNITHCSKWVGGHALRWLQTIFGEKLPSSH
jgi:hypothetical protein